MTQPNTITVNAPTTEVGQVVVRPGVGSNPPTIVVTRTQTTVVNGLPSVAQNNVPTTKVDSSYTRTIVVSGTVVGSDTPVQVVVKYSDLLPVLISDAAAM